jgi:hypothetical protein
VGWTRFDPAHLKKQEERSLGLPVGPATMARPTTNLYLIIIMILYNIKKNPKTFPRVISKYL